MLREFLRLPAAGDLPRLSLGGQRGSATLHTHTLPAGRFGGADSQIIEKRNQQRQTTLFEPEPARSLFSGGADRDSLIVASRRGVKVLKKFAILHVR